MVISIEKNSKCGIIRFTLFIPQKENNFNLALKKSIFSFFPKILDTSHQFKDNHLKFISQHKCSMIWKILNITNMLPLPFIFINYTTYTKKKENKSLFNLFLLIIEESLQSIGFTNRKISLFDYNGRKDFRILSFYFCIIS